MKRKEEFRPYLSMGITAFAVLAAAILLFFVVYHGNKIWGFLSQLMYILRPIFYGLVLAFLLLPVQRIACKILSALFSQKTPPGVRPRKLIIFLSTFFSLMFAALIVYIFLALVLPETYRSLVGLVNAMPEYYKSIQNLLVNFFDDNPEAQDVALHYYDLFSTYFENWFNTEFLPNFQSVSTTLDWIRYSIIPNVSGVMTNVSVVLVGILCLLKDLLIAVIVSVYLLVRKDVFAAQSKKLVYSIFKARWADLIVEETRNAYHILSGFISGKLFDSFIIGLITLVCCNLFLFPYPALVATIVGVTNIIPFFGPFIGAIPCAIFIFLVSPLQCFYFIIFILILQQFDGNILGPKILGESTGLASFWVLFSILLFGGLFGFIGMVLGVPVFAMIYSVATRLIDRSLRERGLPVQASEYMGGTFPNQEKNNDSDVPTS